jgi:7-cyano-7-deazaguanine synthase
MKVVVLLSGGMDSTTAMRLAVDQYGKENVLSVSFNYGQKQSHELLCAANSSEVLGVKHAILELPFLRYLSIGFSANVDSSMEMPTIKEVLGDPQPVTYVPNRNMILMSVAASFAEVNKCKKIITGLQVHDEYGYHDTTQKFVDSLNSALVQNRTWQIEIVAPFVDMSKTEEIKKLLQLDGSADLLKHTITCYNPKNGVSCAACPSCSERIQAFMNVKVVDPIPYAVPIEWGYDAKIEGSE